MTMIFNSYLARRRCQGSSKNGGRGEEYPAREHAQVVIEKKKGRNFLWFAAATNFLGWRWHLSAGRINQKSENQIMPKHWTEASTWIAHFKSTCAGDFPSSEATSCTMEFERSSWLPWPSEEYACNWMPRWWQYSSSTDCSKNGWNSTWFTAGYVIA